MSIRQTLLVAFLMFSMTAAAVITAFAWSRARTALNNEIQLNLESQAVTLVQQVEGVVFERVENVYGWSRLDLMQEVRVHDIDKRLARFLSDIKEAYAGIYNNLACIQNDRVTAAADALTIGATREVPPPWLTVSMPDGSVGLHRPDLRDPNPLLSLTAPLRDAFAGTNLGLLIADFDWMDVLKLLDHVVGEHQRHALLIDADGRVLGASAGLRALPELASLRLASFAGPAARGVAHTPGTALGLDRLLVGYARASGYKGLPDLGWTVLVLTPERVAFTPVTRLLHALLGLLVFTGLVAIALAVALSGRFARPIQALTAATRKLGPELSTMPPLLSGNSEIAELSRAFRRLIDDLKRSRRDLVRVSKLAAVGEMAAMLAHEVRNPLGILRSSAQLLERQRGLDARSREMLGFMLQEADRINDLITSLLENARPRPPAFATHDVNDIVHHVVEMLRPKAAQKAVAIDAERLPTAAPAACDRDQIVQVVLNLALNAVQKTGDGGRVRIRVTPMADGVRVEVADDGPGVPIEQRTAILEPFFSTRGGGIGLGLAVVQDILRRHGSELTVGDSDLGGASFSFTLRLHHEDLP